MKYRWSLPVAERKCQMRRESGRRILWMVLLLPLLMRVASSLTLRLSSRLLWCLLDLEVYLIWICLSAEDVKCSVYAVIAQATNVPVK